MYLNVSPEIAVHVDEIIVIIDWEKANRVRGKKHIIANLTRHLKITDVSNGRPKTLIYLAKNTAYLSSVSVATLRKRGADIFLLGGLY